MISIALALVLQLSGPAVQPPDEAAAAETAVAKPAEPAEPKLVCTWEPVTGTRARKQKVCKTPGYLKGAERSTDMIRNMLTGSGNITPPLSGGGGG